jgi:PAS domain-containing protein
MLEVRLLYRKLQAYNHELEQAIADRTAELRESEARFRGLTELASDWYWEQDADGQLVKVSGPVMDMLGIRVGPLAAVVVPVADDGWDPAERKVLQAHIAARKPFLDFIFHRRQRDGSRQQYRVSGQPMFDESCHFLGYRGIGVEIMAGM